MNEARSKLGLPLGVPLLLFLASAGIQDKRKGWDLLDQALTHVRQTSPDVEVVVVGPPSPDFESASGSKIHWRGHISCNDVLRLTYCAAEITAVPSREDNMPLTAMEAQSCGRPVVAFAIGGLKDIVQPNVSGILAEFEDTHSLAGGISQLLQDPARAHDASISARTHALQTWAPSEVVQNYRLAYEGQIN